MHTLKLTASISPNRSLPFSDRLAERALRDRVADAVSRLLGDGQVFHRCDVPSIKLTSVTESGKSNGWVRAIYGKTWNGKDWIYGWTVHSHKLEGDSNVTYHVEAR